MTTREAWTLTEGMVFSVPGYGEGLVMGVRHLTRFDKVEVTVSLSNANGIGESMPIRMVPSALVTCH
jgi:hypothetical protein